MSNISTKNKVQIVIPAAGMGQRFIDIGIKTPKPLIKVMEKTLIQWVVESLNINGQYMFIVQEKDCQKYEMEKHLKNIVPNCCIIKINGITEGATCTVLKAKEFINNNNPLIIANSDQYVEWDSQRFVDSLTNSKVDGNILIFKDKFNESKWSFVKTNKKGFVTKVAEKVRISNKPTVGIYGFSKGSDFVKYAEQMINKNIRAGQQFNKKAEFYNCLVYQQAIEDNKKIITQCADLMIGLGSPTDIQNFLNNLKNLKN